MKLKLYASLILLAGGLGAFADNFQPLPLEARPILRTKTYRINATDLARNLDEQLARTKVYLNNYKTQSSYIELKGFHFPFQIKRGEVDLDCGLLCPDLGNGYFYVNQVALKSADMYWSANRFNLRMKFEDAGREIKGIHSVLGDNGMPDFNMRGMTLTLAANPVLNSNHKATFRFSNPHLAADIQSTGGCHIAGVDICNKIFGTNRRVQKEVESATLAAFNGSMLQTALVLAVQDYLGRLGVTTQIQSVRMEGSVVVITTL